MNIINYLKGGEREREGGKHGTQGEGGGKEG
jgi:hypothetical protein